MSSRSLSKAQREKVSQFVAVTGSSSRAATECLQQSSWVLEPAVDMWYASGMAQQADRAAQRIDRTAIHQLYERYKDPGCDSIMAEGIMQLCKDLEVEPEDVVMLVLSWHLNAAAMGEYSREEFESGLARLGVDSMPKLRARLPALRAELDTPRLYREVYNFAYAFARERGQKCVQLDMALAMWELLVPPERWRHIEEWCNFLREHHKRAISRDTWSQLLDFMTNVEDDLSNYDENGAWPYLVDEFVSSLKAKRQAAANGAGGGGGSDGASDD